MVRMPTTDRTKHEFLLARTRVSVLKIAVLESLRDA